MVSKRSRLMLKRLRRFFITTVIGGMVVVLPITIFFVVFRFIFLFIGKQLSPISKLLSFAPNINVWIVDLISFGIIIMAFFLLGLIVRTSFGKRFVNKLERDWLSNLPLYDTIRETVRQFTGQKKMPFSQVVLVDIFGTPTRMTGFVTEELADGRYTVFVPTGPNPTNGFIFHVEASQLEFLDVKPEEAMRTIIGVGTGSHILFAPKAPPKPKPEPELTEENQTGL